VKELELQMFMKHEFDVTGDLHYEEMVWGRGNRRIKGGGIP